jgi:uncharacterized membrane protein
MAVSVNTVYTTVLYLLNKEQRGYVTPAEFNSVADLVQKEIFNSYFPDGNQVNRQNQNNTNNDTEFFDMFKDISYKLYPFVKEISFTYNTSLNCWYNATASNIYKIGEVVIDYNGQPKNSSIAQLVSKKDLEKISRSKLTSPTKKYPLFYTSNSIIPNTSFSQLILKTFPSAISGDSVLVNCLINPTSPSWGYTVGGVGQYVFQQINSPNSTSVDFELDISEQTNLIIRILKYFGVVINDPTIIEVAASEEQASEVNLKS